MCFYKSLTVFFRINLLYFFLGSIGIFLLLKELKFNNLQSLFGALAFLFLIHMNIFFQEGHFKKYRTMIWGVYVLYGFMRIIDRQTLFNTGLFAIFLGVMFRAAHYQIVFLCCSYAFIYRRMESLPTL